MGRTFLFLRVRTHSNRIPFKAVRLLGCKPMFLVCLERFQHYVKADGVFATTLPGPQDNLIAWTLEGMGIQTLRQSQRGPWIPKETAEALGFERDDVIVYVGGDEPFIYCEDLQHRVDALKASDCNMIVSAPTDIFPILDWEWAVGPQMWIAKASIALDGFEVINRRGSPARVGGSMPAYRLLIKMGLLRPLLMEKPLAAREPWPWQPFWVDERGQFEKADFIYNGIGADIPTDRQIREFIIQHPEVAKSGANAPRRTVKIFYEDEEMVGLLKDIMKRDGTVEALGI